jgi:hypothetical protein
LAEQENLRESRRRRSILVGRVFDDDGLSGKCIIADLSITGAKVKCEVEFQNGAEVYLKIDKFNDLRRARVMWEREGYTGLQFAEEIRNPPAAMVNFLQPILDQ